MTEWRPIESAPEHEDVLIAQVPSPMVWAAYRVGDEWYFPGDDQSFSVQPTHWMPLPEAPGSPCNKSFPSTPPEFPAETPKTGVELIAEERIYHIAHKVRPDGAVSPWCAKKPRAINLKRESWTFDYARATCERCKAAYRESNRPEAEGIDQGEQRG